MSNLIDNEISQLGLSIKDIRVHQQRIKNSLRKADQNFAILDTCRIDNQSIIPWDRLCERFGQLERQLSGFVAFTPAAGAASRYFKPLSPLLEALQKPDHASALACLRELNQWGAEKWALPKILSEAMQAVDCETFLEDNWERLISALSLPKALQPVVEDGTTFFEIKLLEHAQLEGICGQVFIVPEGKKELFENRLNHPNALNNSSRIELIEQGPQLSTIRFYLDGTPFRDRNNQLVPVPAGHGTLTKLLPEVKRRHEDAHSIFIRNIDNISLNPDTLKHAGKIFFTAHSFILENIKHIRRALSEGHLHSANDHAFKIIDFLFDDTFVYSENITNMCSQDSQHLWALLIQGFHCSQGVIEHVKADAKSELNTLLRLFNRPLNCLGQVANSGKDLGGTPVQTENKLGRFSICLELPHASDEDIEKYLSNPRKATHFNPVFVAAEITENPEEFYETESSDFWILAHKSFQGEDVVYHETVLYELLGNSILANPLFVEIPRSLFNPHKTLEDSIDSPAANWVEM